MGFQLDSGIGVGGSVFANPGFWSGSGGFRGAAQPRAATIPEGNATIAQAAYGTGAPAGAPGNAGYHASLIGAAAFAGLLLLYWTLPK